MIGATQPSPADVPSTSASGSSGALKDPPFVTPPGSNRSSRAGSVNNSAMPNGLGNANGQPMLDAACSIAASPSSSPTSPNPPPDTRMPQQPAPAQQRSSLGFLTGWGRRSMSTSSSSTSSPLRHPSGGAAPNFSDEPNGNGAADYSPGSTLFEDSQGNGGGSTTASNHTASQNGYTSEDESAFILARIEERDGADRSGSMSRPGNRESKTMTSFEAFAAGLRLSFTSVKDSVSAAVASEADEENIDWDFWGKVMNNYEDIARRQARLLTKKLQQGIPDAIRGMVWQLMSRGKSVELEATYRALLTRASPQHEKLIQRDLARTFPKHEHFATVGGPGQESLFNVIKAYSLFDPEVGYCQGIAFIAGPLLLNMPDEEAFCVLVKLMYDYKFRELFTPNMSGLQLRLYQFDKLLDELLPTISRHLASQDIRSNMYASQWFMTMFAYRFPLEMVFRIWDIIFAEGIEAMFRFALALLKRNVDAILTLEFEELLEFLKVGLFDIFMTDIRALIQQAAAVAVSKTRLDKLSTEHLEEMRRNDPELVTVDQLKGETRRLSESLKRVEAGYEALNREHIQLAKEHIDVQERVERGQLRIEELLLQVEGLKRVLTEERLQAEHVVREEMDRLARKNLELTERNGELEDKVEKLEAEVEMGKRRYMEEVERREELQGRWDGLKAALR
ncbi:GTPase-activating protein [Irineochytrium annulatum]|nr:GTPase-activating protein [Irineochytrium annulatum]